MQVEGEMSTLPERETIISSLKRVCEEDPNVRMAFLFGSFASERDIPESDIDIAVYLGDPENYNKLWGKISAASQRDSTDLVILNIARPTIAWAALRGIKLVIKDERFYLKYMLRISSEAEDFQECIFDFWKWRERIREERSVAAHQ